MRNKDGWLSTITVRNDGAEPRDVTVTYFYADGTFAASQNTNLQPNATWSTSLYSWFNNFQGTAIVDGSEDISVVVETLYNGDLLAGAYPGETSADTRLFAPLVLYNWPSLKPGARQTSQLVLHNPSAQTASVTLTFYDSDGSGSGSFAHTLSLAPGAQSVIDPATIGLPIWNASFNATLAAAVIDADQTLAVVVRNTASDASGTSLFGTYRAFTSASAGNSTFLPLVAKQYYTYDTGMQIQNISSGNTSFQVKYYDAAGNLAYNTGTLTLAGYRSLNLWRPASLPAGFLGAAVVTVTSGGPVVAVGQYDHADGAANSYATMQYEALTPASRRAEAPRTDNTAPWSWAGIQAQNMGTSTLSELRLDFFHASGGSQGSATRSNVAPNASVNFFTELSPQRRSAIAPPWMWAIWSTVPWPTTPAARIS